MPDLIHPKELRLSYLLVLSFISSACFSFILSVEIIRASGIGYLCSIFLLIVTTFITIAIVVGLTPIPEVKVNKELDIDENISLISIEHSYKCNVVFKRRYGKTTLLKIAINENMFYDKEELGRVVGFIYTLYRHSFSAMWFIEYLIIPISLILLAEHMIFLVSLAVSMITLLLKIDMLKAIDSKVYLLEHIVKRKSLFGVTHIQVEDELYKALSFIRQKGVIPRSLHMLRSLISTGGM